MTYRVLVIEESPSIRKALKTALPSPEFEVVFFDKVQPGEEGFRRIQPDMIFLSLSLAIKEKPQALMGMRSRDLSGKAPLVLLRKIFDCLEREEVAELDYDEVVQVPFDSQKLASLVRSLIEKRKGPTFLPEESLLDDVSPQETEGELEGRVKAVMRQELMEMEKKIEEKIRFRILTEIKAWLQIRGSEEDEDSKNTESDS